MGSVFKATLELFDDAGWKYITVIHSDATPYKSMRDKFAKAAKQHGTCIAAEIEVRHEVSIMQGYNDKWKY